MFFQVLFQLLVKILRLIEDHLVVEVAEGDSAGVSSGCLAGVLGGGADVEDLVDF